MAGQFSSPEILCLPAGSLQQHTGAASGLAWAVSLWNERGLGGLLLLGEKVDCNPFTQEEMEIAQAGGERLLDMLAGVEMARLAMDLLRQRLSQQRVLEGRSRRVLHDEVLPELHTAILYLSGQQDTPEIREAVETLAKAHRSISDLMRYSLPNAPQRLEQGGLVQALRAVLDGDLAGECSVVEWQVDGQPVRRLAGSLCWSARWFILRGASCCATLPARTGRRQRPSTEADGGTGAEKRLALAGGR